MAEQRRTTVPLVALPGFSANDNKAPPQRRLLRELLFLGILVVTLLGAFQTGRTYGAHTIIVVPEPANARHTVT